MTARILDCIEQQSNAVDTVSVYWMVVENKCCRGYGRQPAVEIREVREMTIVLL